MESLSVKIENFLGLKLPQDLDLSAFGSDAKFLDRPEIEKVLLERSPFYFVEKAIVFGKDHDKVVLTKLTISKERCEGHFPSPLRTIAPFIEFFKACAQSAILLGGLMVPNHVTIANGEGRFVSFNKRFIFAPVDVFVVAKVDSWLEYGIKFLGDTKIYADSQPIAQLWTEYVLINEKVFRRLVREK